MAKGKKKNRIKFYAVKKGFKPGIYNNWEECKAQVFKFPGAIYKSFETLSEAQNFLGNKKTITNKSEAYAYIDGSFNKFTNIYGYGGFIKYKDEKYYIIYRHDPFLKIFISI